MAVLVEGISVIVRRDAMDERFHGGWHAFESVVPNATLCADDELVRVGFMAPRDVEAFVRTLERGGLVFMRNNQAAEIAVVDQLRGPTMAVEWLEFAHLYLGNTGDKVAACWLCEGPRTAVGLRIPATDMTLATPESWTYEESLSAKFRYVGDDEIDDQLDFVRHEDGRDVYRDRATGREVYVGRFRT